MNLTVQGVAVFGNARDNYNCIVTLQWGIFNAVICCTTGFVSPDVTEREVVAYFMYRVRPSLKGATALPSSAKAYK